MLPYVYCVVLWAWFVVRRGLVGLRGGQFTAGSGCSEMRVWLGGVYYLSYVCFHPQSRTGLYQLSLVGGTGFSW